MDKCNFEEHRKRLLITEHKRKFARPSLDQDLLFQAPCRHISETEGCESCDMGQLVDRPARTEEAASLVFHRGRIASGNAVVKDGERRDQIREVCRGALCIEMEAAGVDVSRRCLVIRGISNYSDAHKNDTWQAYAAGNAAIFARELLSKVPARIVKEPENVVSVWQEVGIPSNMMAAMRSFWKGGLPILGQRASNERPLGFEEALAKENDVLQRSS